MKLPRRKFLHLAAGAAALPAVARIAAEPLLACVLRQRAASLSRVNLLVARIVIAISVALVFVSGHGVSSEPMRTIKIVVPSPPGGVVDNLARLLGDQISRAQGQTILIENRSG